MPPESAANCGASQTRLPVARAPKTCLCQNKHENFGHSVVLVAESHQGRRCSFHVVRFCLVGMPASHTGRTQSHDSNKPIAEDNLCQHPKEGFNSVGGPHRFNKI